MFPGMNNKQMQRMMKQMGVKQEDVDATEVIIRTDNKEIVFSNPGVAKVEMMGNKTWQITGKFEERALNSSPDISDDDIQTVVDQADVSEEEARKAIEDADGDLAQAIMDLSN